MPDEFPTWLRKRLPTTKAVSETQQILTNLKLHTVCQEALCPNQGECFARRTATFMILGEVCTRGCRFCAVEGGKPLPPDQEEPKRLAEAAAKLHLKHIVVTSVTRDDLPDGGAALFAATINEIKRRLPGSTVEVLTPDFQGDIVALRKVLAAGPDVFAHNIETSPQLYRLVRPGASYLRSLNMLQEAKKMAPMIYVKSGLMVGLGEKPEEVETVLQDLRAVGCDAVTIGQYLSPSPKHLPVVTYITPATFDRYRDVALNLGFSYVASSPFVRSSFHADEIFD